MDYKLINYNGIDNLDSINTDSSYIFNIDEYIVIDDNIEDILSFSISNEIISSKKIDTFEDVNYEGYEVNSKLFLITIKYDLIIEYSTENYNYKISAINKVIYKTLFLKYDSLDHINVNIYTIDIFCRKNNRNEIYYYIHSIVLF